MVFPYRDVPKQMRRRVLQCFRWFSWIHFQEPPLVLGFIVYDRTTEGGVGGASPVEPTLVGSLDLVFNERVAWSPQNPLTKQVLPPVEVKAYWAPLIVLQAAANALCSVLGNLVAAARSRLSTGSRG